MSKNIPLLLDKNPNVRQMAAKALATIYSMDPHTVSAAASTVPAYASQSQCGPPRKPTPTLDMSVVWCDNIICWIRSICLMWPRTLIQTQ